MNEHTEPQPTSALERLAARHQAMGVVQHHVTWGPGDAAMTDEGRAAVLLELYATVDADMSNTVAIPVSQLVAMADALKTLSRIGQMGVAEWTSQSDEMRQLRRQVGSLAEFPAMYAEQWLPVALQKQRRGERLAKAPTVHSHD